METFATIRLKRNTAERFRAYSKTIAKTHSEAIDLIIDFFEHNTLSPNDTLESGLMASEIRVKKRINALIAIIKDIEKTQTKPTLAMLHALFEGAGSDKKPLLVEKNFREEVLVHFREKSYSDFKKVSEDLDNSNKSPN